MYNFYLFVKLVTLEQIPCRKSIDIAASQVPILYFVRFSFIQVFSSLLRHLLKMPQGLLPHPFPRMRTLRLLLLLLLLGTRQKTGGFIPKEYANDRHIVVAGRFLRAVLIQKPLVVTLLDDGIAGLLGIIPI